MKLLDQSYLIMYTMRCNFRREGGSVASGDLLCFNAFFIFVCKVSLFFQFFDPEIMSSRLS